MKNIIMLIFSITIFAGCSSISPVQRCNTITSITKFGVKIGLDKFGDKINISEHNKKIVENIKTKVLPKLEGEKADIKDINDALNFLNINIKDENVKEAIQVGINTSLSFAKIPQDGSIFGTALDVIRCLFKGILQGFLASNSTNQNISKKNIPKNKPKFEIRLKKVLLK